MSKRLQFFLILFMLTLHSWTASSQLSGSYTIGPSGADYTSFSAAIDDITQYGINGDVTFLIADGTYTESFEIGEYTGNETYQVTFQAASEDAEKVLITYASTGWSDKQTISLNKANGINFESITVTFDGFAGNGVYIKDSHNLKFNNCIFNGIDYNSNLVRIISQSYFGEPSSNIIFTNNAFSKADKGLSIQGGMSKHSQNIQIENNTFTDLLSEGISLFICDNISIIKNTFRSGESVNQSASSHGIKLDDCKNYNISQNDIFVYYGKGVYLTGCSYDGINNIINNFITVKMKPGGTNITGIDIEHTNNLDLAFNTIRTIENDISFPSYSLAVISSSNIQAVNNIFNSNMSFNLLVDDPVSFSLIDYNCYNGNTPMHHKISDSERTALSLGDWTTQTSNDQNSLKHNPEFTSESDSRHNSVELKKKGLSFMAITTDIDDQQRETPPSIGASVIGQSTGIFDSKDQAIYAFKVENKQLIPLQNNFQDLTVFNLSGSEVYRVKGFINESINLNHLTPGLYILQTKHNQQKIIQKIVLN